MSPGEGVQTVFLCHRKAAVVARDVACTRTQRSAGFYCVIVILRNVGSGCGTAPGRAADRQQTVWTNCAVTQKFDSWLLGCCSVTEVKLGCGDSGMSVES